MKIPVKTNQKIKSSKDIFSIMQRILLRENKHRRKQEYFWTIGLTTSNRVEYIELVALGKLNTVSVEPTEIFSWALQKHCKKIIIVHNHPSGETNPSEEDKKLTSYLADAALFLKLRLEDHLIITEKKYFSFADNKKTSGFLIGAPFKS
jgi:DNA repair protein RadC